MNTNKEEWVEEFVEKGANLEHERWAKWQEYFFGKCQVKPQSQVNGMDDRYVYFALSKDLYERWNRQITTPYSELSEQEKESDREEVRKYLPLLREERAKVLDDYRKQLREKVEHIRCDDGLGWSDEIKGYNQALQEVLELINNNHA